MPGSNTVLYWAAAKTSPGVRASCRMLSQITGHRRPCSMGLLHSIRQETRLGCSASPCLLSPICRLLLNPANHKRASREELGALHGPPGRPLRRNEEASLLLQPRRSAGAPWPFPS